MTTPRQATPREHLAWLMYCYREGYRTSEERAHLTNWMATDDPSGEHPDDIRLRDGLLTMADEVLDLTAKNLRDQLATMILLADKLTIKSYRFERALEAARTALDDEALTGTSSRAYAIIDAVLPGEPREAPAPAPVAGTPGFDAETARLLRETGNKQQAAARDGFAKRAREAQKGPT